MADFKEEEFEEFETVIMTDEDTGEEIEFAISEAMIFIGNYATYCYERNYSEFLDCISLHYNI